MSTVTVPALSPDADGYVKRQLLALIRDHGERLREAGGEKLEHLVVHVHDELDRDSLDRDALHRAAIAVYEHTGNLHQTAETLLSLAATIARGWAPDEPL